MAGKARDRSGPQWYVRLLDPVVDDGGGDLSQRVVALKYEDTEKGSDKLTLTVDNYDLAAFDAPVWKHGNVLEVSWGYEGDMTPPREVVIQSAKGFQTLTVEALARSALLNRIPRTRTFEIVRRSDVARAIAEENGYGSAVQIIDDTSEVLPAISQAKQTDAALLAALARREGWEWFIDWDGFHFHPRRVGQRPLRELVYFLDGSGDVLSVSIENDIYGKPGGVSAKGRDPLAKEDIDEHADNSTEAGRDTLSPVIEVIDRQTGAASEQARRVATEAIVQTTEPTAAAAKRQAAGAFARSQQLTVEAKIKVVGDPSLVAKSVVLVSGIGKTLSGRYYLSAVTTTVSTDVYTCELTAKRDGKSAPTTTGSGGATAESSGHANDHAPNPDGSAGGAEAVEVIDKATGKTTTEWRDARGRSSR